MYEDKSCLYWIIEKKCFNNKQRATIKTNIFFICFGETSKQNWRKRCKQNWLNVWNKRKCFGSVAQIHAPNCIHAMTWLQLLLWFTVIAATGRACARSFVSLTMYCTLVSTLLFAIDLQFHQHPIISRHISSINTCLLHPIQLLLRKATCNITSFNPLWTEFFFRWFFGT